jgi:hypothetical protein
LPTYYDAAGAVPQVKLPVWAIDDDGDCSSPDPGGRKAKFAVSSRSYIAGSLLTSAWSAADEAEAFFGCVESRNDDSGRTLTIDAAPSAASWSAGALIFIRIRRVDVYPEHQEFVHVPSVSLRIPTN